MSDGWELPEESVEPLPCSLAVGGSLPQSTRVVRGWTIRLAGKIGLVAKGVDIWIRKAVWSSESTQCWSWEAGTLR